MRLSIITVVKNDKKNLEFTIKSVLAQNYKDFEYIIFDGLSSDRIESVINKYKKKNIKYIRRSDKNYYDGLNQAISKAKGDYIGILNAGDLYNDKNVLKIVVEKLLMTKCDLLFSNLMYCELNKKNTRFWKFPIQKLSKLSALRIASPTLFVKKKIFEANPYDIKYDISSDTDFNLSISSKKYTFVYLNKYIVLMKKGGLSTRYSSFPRKIFQDLLILKKHFGFLFFGVYIYKILLKIKQIMQI
jgi:glycosyltransferase